MFTPKSSIFPILIWKVQTQKQDIRSFWGPTPDELSRSEGGVLHAHRPYREEGYACTESEERGEDELLDIGDGVPTPNS